MDPNKGQGLIKVTTETYYQPYTGDEESLEVLADDWFRRSKGEYHAYREGSKLPFVNLVKVEILTV